MSLMAVVTMLVMTGCDVPPFDDESTIEGTRVCTVWHEGSCMAYTTVPDGSVDGTDGLSAYELAVIGGFVGTEAEWLESLHGTDGVDGMSAYELAVLGGFEGTLEEWLLSLIGATGEKGDKGDTGEDGKDLICYSWEPIVPCEPCITPPPVIEEPIKAGFARMTFRTNEVVSNLEAGHLLGMSIASLDTLEEDGKAVKITTDVNISDVGEHMIGYRFNK